jgi:hypothetical protein
VENISVLDITSAYPDAMRWLPDPARCRYLVVDPGPYHQDVFRGLWGALVVSGEGLDPHIPALREHDRHNNRLRYIYGAFHQVTATIPEIVIGVESGRLRIDQIHGGVVIDGDYETSFLRTFVHMVFAIKDQAEKDSPLYLIAKLLMNSLYGKLIEVREIKRAPLGMDGLYLIPNWQQLEDPDFVGVIRDAYILGGLEALEDLRFGMKTFPLKPGGPSEIPLKKVLTTTEYMAGHYFLPLHAAQVTGFVSAKLGLAAWATDSLQGDTDSIFTTNPGGLEEYHRIGRNTRLPVPGSGRFRWRSGRRPGSWSGPRSIRSGPRAGNGSRLTMG